MLQSGGQNHNWPTSGQIGNMTPAFCGAQRFGAGQQISNWPQVGRLATYPLLSPSRGSLTLRSGGGGSQQWPTSGQLGCIHPTVWGLRRFGTGDKISSGPHMGSRVIFFCIKHEYKKLPKSNFFLQ